MTDPSDVSDNIVNMAQRRAKAKADGEQPPSVAKMADKRPVVEIRGAALHENVTEIERLLIAAGEPMIFQRGINLVNIIRLPEKKREYTLGKEKGEITRAAGSPMINLLTPEVMRRRMDEVIRFVKWDGRINALVAKDPPRDYAEVLLRSCGMWNFAPLLAVSETPILRPDGSIFQTRGYDEETGIYYWPSLEFPEIPDRPSPDDAVDALSKIRWIYKDFPFVGRVMNHEGEEPSAGRNESVALASTLTALIRRILSTAPMFLFDAAKQGSGKTLLNRIAAHIVTGRDPAIMTWTGDEAEERKKLISLLLNGDALGSYDNIDIVLQSRVLCAVLTNPTFSDRLLGKNNAGAKLVAPTCCTFMGTGNNLIVGGDMRTRVAKCRIDANMSHPEQRNLDENVLLGIIEQRRAKIVYFCLLILRAYFVAGCPSMGLTPCRFPQWSNIVRSALVWLGCEDPMLTAADVQETDDTLSLSLQVLDQLDLLMFQKGGLLVGEIKAAAEEQRQGRFGEDAGYVRKSLREALFEVAPGDRGEINPRALGRYLSNLNGAVFQDDKKKLVGENDKHACQKRWTVILNPNQPPLSHL